MDDYNAVVRVYEPYVEVVAASEFQISGSDVNHVPSSANCRDEAQSSAIEYSGRWSGDCQGAGRRLFRGRVEALGAALTGGSRKPYRGSKRRSI